MKKLYQIVAGAVSLAMVAVMGIACYYSAALPDHFYVTAGAVSEGISIGSALAIQGEIQPLSERGGTAELTMLGGIAVKQVDVQFVDREQVIPWLPLWNQDVHRGSGGGRTHRCGGKWDLPQPGAGGRNPGR